ncbi:MAG TPA: glutamine-hydrolyzing GMP synthase [Anaerolineales bacterium]|nr:glutamine-hydrolyzing GMP synthase [Anaerolineales bacterium]HMX20292.1 glutamine-hydrolyzing GMP synthase [Anaerolineales bacterium]HMX75332.1 glutamine-hydrolyzing GMP synthase [Anaerolineales bacterium]HMZ43108.1 glutamine-hydrolyzing GMP synthase [Anaerolineales bacterium]HNA55471.1 glutamine-hydrolyzing GMP synthase [Anaerolineales bacterium]
MNSIAILDFGSQYAQIIARRIREVNVYCELFPWDAPQEKILSINPKGFILSGGPKSVYEENAPYIQKFILESGLPIFGICYGMQALTHALGGEVNPSSEREFGFAEIEPLIPNTMLDVISKVWMSHGDKVTRLPQGFMPLAKSGNSPYAAIGDLQRKYFGVQFHPEVNHTPNGTELLKHFAIEICGAKPEWTPASIIDESVKRIREQVGSQRVLAAVSGGVDSSVAAALVHKAIGDQLVCVFVDTGLLRHNEGEQVASAFRGGLGAELITVEASADFLGALAGVTDPEQKRKIVGEKFIRIFEQQAKNVGQPKFLVQGTIYPDVVESSAPDRNKADKIKTHHNVGGLPKDMQFELVEPLRYLFKDEVRLVGEALGLSEALVWRQPFPGPGLTVRCLGECTPERVSRLRAADAILLEELSKAGFLGKGAKTSQAFMVLLPVKSVGVMGDYRTYQEAAAIRAVVTDDFMTADWARLPYDLLAKVSSRVVNEVDGINRVVYDVTSKPPATIEWE